MSSTGCAAVLIDGDNIAPNQIPTVFDIITDKGCKILLKRVYGNFLDPKMKNWGRTCQEFLLESIQVWSVNGKQSTDLKITVDGMELLSNHHISIYVLVTGDRDFLHLIRKLRFHGKTVVGISQSSKATSKSLQKACDEFYMLDRIKASYKDTLLVKSDGKNQEEEDSSTVDSFTELVQTIRSILSRQDRPVNMGHLKELLQSKNPTFNHTNFGFNKFGQLVDSIDCLKISSDKRRPRPTFFVELK